MGLFKNPFSLISLTLLLLSGFGFFSVSRAVDNTDLVYKGCANQTFSDPLLSQTLNALFNSLTAQSAKSKFYKANSGNGQTTISGLFQCRGDLSNDDCYKCVSKIPGMVSNLCGNTVAGRIQLIGCYGLYEVSGFPQVSGYEMLFKTCSRSQAAGSGFEMRRDTAFSTMETGISSGNTGGFYATSYEAVYALGQCEGTLSTGDCADCVKAAVQKAQVECGSSISGQIYLHKCYMSYAYYPNGISKKSFSEGGSHQNTGKTIAIVVGGVAAVGFAFICLMFLRSLMKKHDGMDGQRNTLSNKAPQVFSLNINKGNGTSIARQRSAPVARPSQVTTKNMDKGNGINIPRQISAPPTVPSQVILPPQAYKGKKKLGDEYSKGQCRWDATMVENLVEVMLDIVTTFGKRADNGNRREAYPLAAEEMNKRGFLVTKDHVINKLRQMKKEYNVASETRKKSGFEFDHELKVIKADSNAWAKWVKERPEARMLRTKWLQYYDECAVIFGSD